MTALFGWLREYVSYLGTKHALKSRSLSPNGPLLRP